MKTNILVQYQGGGYDGCFWEWNYFYIDRQGAFYDIFSSGRKAVTSIENVEELMWADCPHTYIYDMGKDEDINTFSNECNAVHVTGVLQFFDDNIDELGVKFFAVCGECGEQIEYDDGIVLEQNMILCPDCNSTGSCPCCESYVGDTEIVKVEPDEHYGFDYICDDCKIYHDDEREANNLEDLQFQSFCTGEPDMFSDELRQIWTG